MDIASRITAHMANRGVSVSDVARKSGLTYQGIEKILGGLSVPKIDSLEKICDALDISLSTLFSDDQTIYIDRHIMNLYHSASSFAREIAILVLERGASANEKNANIVSSDNEAHSTVSIPVVGKAAAGLPIEMIAQSDMRITLPNANIRKGDFAVIVDGESMAGDDIHDGDRAIIRPQEIVENGELALVAVGDGSTIKRVYVDVDGCHLKSSNPAYPDQHYTNPNDIRILGRVLNIYRPL